MELYLLLLNRIKTLMIAKGIKNGVALTDLAGTPRNTISNIKIRKSVPSAENLTKIADALGCSVDYLLGRTDDPNKEKPFDINTEGLTEKQQELLQLMLTFDRERFDKVLDYVQYQAAQLQGQIQPPKP